jgi:molybdopterin-guanine dinucleotide biosynthesis protein A
MSESRTARRPHAGVILAGGLGKRMGGGDKPLLALDGKPMLARVIERLAPQVERLVLNANGDPARFAAYGLPVVPDTIEGFAGPLAGILAGMRWAKANVPEGRFMVSAAADTPFFPSDLVARLSEGCGNDERTIALAASTGGTHPVFGLWPVALADELEAFLLNGEGGKILSFADRYLRLNVPFDDILLPDGSTADPFFNVNTPDDAARAKQIAAALDALAA